MQLRHFHLLPTKQPLQFLPVAGSFALADLLTQLLDIDPAIDADAILVAGQQFLQDVGSQLVLLLGELRFCITLTILMRKSSILFLKFFSPFLFYSRMVSISIRYYGRSLESI